MRSPRKRYCVVKITLEEIPGSYESNYASKNYGIWIWKL